MGEDLLRAAYEETLRNAAKNGTSSFMCGGIICRNCPFGRYQGHCTDETVLEGAGYKRNMYAWQLWWYDQTGERDTRTREQILGDAGTDAGTDTANTEGSTDTLQPIAPTVNITWTTATGAVEHHVGPMSLLCEEMHRFRKELSVWMECMSIPAEQIGNSVAEQIVFTATDSTGAVIAKCELFAELFGKCKCWRSLEK